MTTFSVHLPRSHGSAISIASSSFAFKQMPLRLQADAAAATSRCHCGYKQMRRTVGGNMGHIVSATEALVTEALTTEALAKKALA